MSFSLDTELAEGLASLFAQTQELPALPVGDVNSRRQSYDAVQREMHAQLPVASDVTITDYEATADDGQPVLLRWFEKDAPAPGAAVLYAHGSGMIQSSVDIYERPISRYVSATGVPFLAVGYRKAPEFPAPVPMMDCYSALKWLATNAPELGVATDRIAVMGDSAGGGIAASLAIFARDHGGPAIAKQILIYPMLDDSNVQPDPELAPHASWTYDDNATGWGALLGAEAGGDDVSPYAAAGRLQQFSGLPSAYIEVGELDIFRDESIRFALGLYGAGVSTELHVHPGVVHGFEAFVPQADVSTRAVGDRLRVLSTL